MKSTGQITSCALLFSLTFASAPSTTTYETDIAAATIQQSVSTAHSHAKHSGVSSKLSLCLSRSMSATSALSSSLSALSRSRILSLFLAVARMLFQCRSMAQDLSSSELPDSCPASWSFTMAVLEMLRYSAMCIHLVATSLESSSRLESCRTAGSGFLAVKTAWY